MQLLRRNETTLCTFHRRCPGALFTLLLLAWTPVAQASDGTPDVDEEYPAVVGYYEYYVYLGGTIPWVGYAAQSCSGALVSEKVILTAAHCTAWNYVYGPGIEGFSDEAWVTFDVTATDNDFRCFLTLVAHVPIPPGCIPWRWTEPHPTFHKVAVAGRIDGIPIAHGLTHPDFLRPVLGTDGRADVVDPNLQNASDVGLLILEEPIVDVEPMPIRAVGELDTIPDLKRTPTVSVGYGANWTKITGQPPTWGLGPMTDLGGGSGVRRIAQLGPVQSVHANSLWPRQDVLFGDDAVCFGDSGSPLFLVQDGQVDPAIVGVLSGWTNWCQGSKDPFYRVDQQAARDFIDCVIERQDDVKQACQECGAENDFGLCDEL